MEYKAVMMTTSGAPIQQGTATPELGQAIAEAIGMMLGAYVQSLAFMPTNLFAREGEGPWQRLDVTLNMLGQLDETTLRNIGRGVTATYLAFSEVPGNNP